MTALTEAAGRYRAVAALLEEHPPLIGADEKGHNAAAVRRGHRGRDLCPGLLPPLRGVARRRRTEVVEISRFVVDRRDEVLLNTRMEATENPTTTTLVGHVIRFTPPWGRNRITVSVKRVDEYGWAIGYRAKLEGDTVVTWGNDPRCFRLPADLATVEVLR